MELMDRYIYDIGRRLPAKQRKDIEKELASLLADALDARVEGREPTETDVLAIITDFGAPAEVASFRTSSTQGSLLSALSPSSFSLSTASQIGTPFRRGCSRRNGPLAIFPRFPAGQIVSEKPGPSSPFALHFWGWPCSTSIPNGFRSPPPSTRTPTSSFSHCSQKRCSQPIFPFGTLAGSLRWPSSSSFSNAAVGSWEPESLTLPNSFTASEYSPI